MFFNVTSFAAVDYLLTTVHCFHDFSLLRQLTTRIHIMYLGQGRRPTDFIQGGYAILWLCSNLIVSNFRRWQFDSHGSLFVLMENLWLPFFLNRCKGGKTTRSHLKSFARWTLFFLLVCDLLIELQGFYQLLSTVSVPSVLAMAILSCHILLINISSPPSFPSFWSNIALGLAWIAETMPIYCSFYISVCPLMNLDILSKMMVTLQLHTTICSCQRSRAHIISYWRSILSVFLVCLIEPFFM